MRNVRKTILKFVTGTMLLILPFPHELRSALAPIGEWMNAVKINAPALKEELAHERAMKSARQAAEREVLPGVKVFMEQSRVQSDLDSGFLTNARIEIPIFNKTKDYLAAKTAILEEQIYGAQRRKAQCERLFEMRSDYAELQFLFKTLPFLLEKQEIINGIVEGETRLNVEKIKPLDDLGQFYQEKILLDQTLDMTKARLEVLKSKMTYASGINNQTLDFAGSIQDSLPNEPENDRTHWVNVAISNNAEILTLALEARKQAVQVSLAKREYLPEISAFSTYARDPRFVRNENQVFAGVQVRLDLWSFGSNWEKVKEQKALLEEAEAKFENKKIVLAIQVEESFREYLAAYRAFKAYETYHEFQKKVMQSWDERYEEGEVSRRERLFARARFLNTEIAFESAKKEALQKEAGFYRAVGIGGAGTVNVQ